MLHYEMKMYRLRCDGKNFSFQASWKQKREKEWNFWENITSK